MSWGVEFGTKAGADAAREEFAEYVCPADDDKRQKTVHFVSDTPDHVRDRIEAGATTGRAEGQEGSGQAELTEEEKNRAGPFTGSNNYRKAASVKALFRDNGVSDWLAWYDPTLSVDEHRSSVLPEAQQAGGGDRIENEGPDRDAAARNEKAVNEECDHAKNHCKHGDPEACEYLQEACDVPETEVKTLLQFGDGPVPYEELSGAEKGALDRSWNGYTVAVRRLATLLDEVAMELRHAEKAAAAIDAIEAGIIDEDTGTFEALASHHETLHELHRRHSGEEHGQPGEGRVPTDGDLRNAEPDQPVRPSAGPPPESDVPAGSLDLDAPTTEELQVPDQQHEADMAKRAESVGPWDPQVSRSEAGQDARKSPGEMRDEELFAEVMERLNGDDGAGAETEAERQQRASNNSERRSRASVKTALTGRTHFPATEPSEEDRRKALEKVKRSGGPEDEEGQTKLADDVEPEQDGPSEEHRRAQNNGYLRSGSRGFDEEASAREGLGQFAATGGEQTLDEFEDDESESLEGASEELVNGKWVKWRNLSAHANLKAVKPWIMEVTGPSDKYGVEGDWLDKREIDGNHHMDVSGLEPDSYIRVSGASHSNKKHRYYRVKGFEDGEMYYERADEAEVLEAVS